MRLDKFSWFIVIAVVLLLIAAVVSVNLSGRGDTLEYVTEDAPTTPVQNAFVAVQRGEFSQAREQYSARVLEELSSSTGYDPFSGVNMTNTARRLRILDVSISPSNPDRATVTYAIDTFYRNSGPFGSGSSWSREGIVEVVREGGVWKIDSSEYFTY
jgi:hypothetical protein